MTTTAPQDVPADLGPSGTPNVYHLHGEGIRITYYPEGSGPPTADGPVELIYQDLHRTLTFRAHEVTVDQVPSLGSLVSVVVQSTPDFGSRRGHPSTVFCLSHRLPVELWCFRGSARRGA
jgi:hypothetical protein